MEEKIKKIQDEIRKTLLEKNAEYGDAWIKVDECLKILSRNEAPENILLVTRILDKFSRILNTSSFEIKREAWIDICGYSTLALVGMGNTGIRFYAKSKRELTIEDLSN